MKITAFRNIVARHGYKRLILAAAVIAALVFVVPWSSGWSKFNKFLKTEINDSFDREDSIQKIKEARFEKIRQDSTRLARQDSLIRELYKIQASKEAEINSLRYENQRLKTDYLNRDLNERIRVFARLATEKDSI